jgi:uncharacterized protein (UPF0276 family)
LIIPILEEKPPLDWLEILTDCYLDADPQRLAELEEIRAAYPLVMHGGGLSIAGPEPLDPSYLAKLRSLADRLEAVMISDHLCWIPDSLSENYIVQPLPRTRVMIQQLIPRIVRVQEYLGQRILLENISGAKPLETDQMPAADFISEVAEGSDSLILLDLNNVISSSLATGLDPLAYINRLPAERIWQIHLAPMVSRTEYAWDADTSPCEDPVWQLYRNLIQRCGPVPTMLERNDDIPPLSELLEELEQAKQIVRQTTANSNLAEE